MKRLTLTILTFFALTTIQASDFDKWDADDDGIIERHEFTSHFINHYFDHWDTDNETGIIEEGFFKESYAGLDTDNDNLLSDEEWLIGYNYFFEDYLVYDKIAYYDTNNDGVVEYKEFSDVIYDTAYFTDVDVDQDNYISEYELANYVFENWDSNDSGMISKSEFNQFDWYYLDV